MEQDGMSELRGTAGSWLTGPGPRHADLAAAVQPPAQTFLITFYLLIVSLSAIPTE